MATVTRGRILRGDQANWDGKTATATRLDATGGTITGLAIGNEVDVLQVYGSGTSRTRGTIADAVQRIGSTTVTLVFMPGTWTIDDDLTIASNFTCKIPRGVLFEISSGKTLTFSGPVYTDSSTFTSGAGSYVLSVDSIIGGKPYIARTAAEISAGVTPTDFYKQIDDSRRLNFVAGNSAAVNKTALENMALVANQDYRIVPGTYAYSPSVTFAIQKTLRGVPGMTILQPSGNSASAATMTFSANDSGIEGVHFDCQNVDDYQVLSLSGDRCFADISMASMEAITGAASGNVAGVVVSGSNSWINVRARSFANTGAANASFPRVVSLAATAVNTQVDLTVHTGAAGIVVTAGAARPYLRRIECHDMEDNGIYNLGSVELVCDVFIYDGDEEGWVEQGTKTYVNSIYVRHQNGAGASIDFEDATDFYCANAVIHDFVTTAGNETNFYIGSRVANTLSSGIHFGNVYIRSRGNGVFKFNNGTVNELEFDNIHVIHDHYDSAQEKALFIHDGDRLRIGSLRFHIEDSEGTGSNDFTWTLDTAYTEESYIGKWLVTCDTATDEIRLINFAQDNFVIQQIEIDDTPRGLNLGHLGSGGGMRKICYAGAAPVAGTWRVGDMVMRREPAVSSSNITTGWVCTVAGTPGTWQPMIVSNAAFTVP